MSTYLSRKSQRYHSGGAKDCTCNTCVLNSPVKLYRDGPAGTLVATAGSYNVSREWCGQQYLAYVVRNKGAWVAQRETLKEALQVIAESLETA